MKNTAIIDYDDKFTSFHEFLFKIGKLNNKYIKEEITVAEKNIKVFKVPVSSGNISKKKKLNLIINKFIYYLKENNINKIIISDKANSVMNLKELFNNNFFIFEGKSIIKFKFSYIIKKCINNSDSEIVFFSNDFNKFFEYFKLIFKNYRVASLVTDYKNMFLSFSDEIFSEYGFFINVLNESEFLYKEDLFIINTDTKMKKDYFNIDLNNFSLLFSKNESFKSFYNYVKISDEKSLEFLIYNIYEGLEKSKITEFFDKYNLRIVKINKK